MWENIISLFCLPETLLGGVKICNQSLKGEGSKFKVVTDKHLYIYMNYEKSAS